MERWNIPNEMRVLDVIVKYLNGEWEGLSLTS
jgi:hypothetical protein